MGAIFMSEYASVSARTKHVGTRSNFACKFAEDRFIQIAGNVADYFTKNVTGNVFCFHVKEFIPDGDPTLK
jgi:hypothetical protein